MLRVLVLLALASAACSAGLHAPRAAPLRATALGRVRAPPRPVCSDSGETPPAADGAVTAEEPDDGLTEKQREIQRLRDAEVFMQKDTGRYECRTCSYVYDPEKGDGLLAKPGTDFQSLPDNWRCPQCQSPKPFFESQMLTIAGFADNQNYGFGGNSMTEGQKSNLIFGGLFIGFLLLMSGYLLT